MTHLKQSLLELFSKSELGGGLPLLDGLGVLLPRLLHLLLWHAHQPRVVAHRVEVGLRQHFLKQRQYRCMLSVNNAWRPQ